MLQWLQGCYSGYCQWTVAPSGVCLYVNKVIYLPVVLPDPMLRIEVWIDDTHWTLTHSDGQLHLADICFTNFSYNRLTFKDDSGEHKLELGTFKVQNLMPNTPTIYQVGVHVECVCVCVYLELMTSSSL